MVSIFLPSQTTLPATMLLGRTLDPIIANCGEQKVRQKLSGHASIRVGEGYGVLDRMYQINRGPAYEPECVLASFTSAS
jgi:hypothetical protein